MKEFAIIEAGGKQYRISAGQTVKMERLVGDAGVKVVFDKVLLRAKGDHVEIGAPYVPSARVDAKLLGTTRGEKKIVFKYHPKTRYRKKKGHRQEYSEVQIENIS